MPDNTEEIDLTKIDLADILIKAGVPELFMANSLVAGMILNDAIDFIKKIGALNEFVEALNISDRMFLKALLKTRPKKLGGNPFET